MEGRAPSSCQCSCCQWLAPGIRFNPTDEELIVHYLDNWVAGRPLPCYGVVIPTDVYANDPWDLLGKGSEEGFFFAQRKKHEGGRRPKRMAGLGTWRASTNVEVITASIAAAADGGGEAKTVVIGRKRGLSFACSGRKYSGWFMYEYELGSNDSEEWVLCRVKRSQRGKRKRDDLDGAVSCAAACKKWVGSGCQLPTRAPQLVVEPTEQQDQAASFVASPPAHEGEDMNMISSSLQPFPAQEPRMWTSTDDEQELFPLSDEGKDTGSSLKPLPTQDPGMATSTDDGEVNCDLATFDWDLRSQQSNIGQPLMPPSSDQHTKPQLFFSYDDGEDMIKISSSVEPLPTQDPRMAMGTDDGEVNWDLDTFDWDLGSRQSDIGQRLTLPSTSDLLMEPAELFFYNEGVDMIKISSSLEPLPTQDPRMGTSTDDGEMNWDLATFDWDLWSHQSNIPPSTSDQLMEPAELFLEDMSSSLEPLPTQEPGMATIGDGEVSCDIASQQRNIEQPLPPFSDSNQLLEKEHFLCDETYGTSS